MSEVADIRARLEAVKDLDWTNVERDTTEEEYWTRWVHVGPVMMFAASDVDGAHPNVVERVKVEQVKQAALIEFLTHAAADIERLLADRTAT